MSRRNLLAATALASLGALAACAQIESLTGTTTPTAAVQAVYNATQFVLPLLDALALGISVTVPVSAGVLSLVTGYLNQAMPIFQQFVVTMSQSQAQPLVQQIEGYVSDAVSAIATAVQANPKLAAYQSRVAQAQAVVGLLTAFVNGISTMPKAIAPIRLLHT
jgi:hypothetical protein